MEIPIRPLVLKVPGERTYIERTFVERTRDTEPLPVVNIESPAPPSSGAGFHITVNVPERSKDEQQNVPAKNTPKNDIGHKKGRTDVPEKEVPPPPPATEVRGTVQPPETGSSRQAEVKEPETGGTSLRPEPQKEEKNTEGRKKLPPKVPPASEVGSSGDKMKVYSGKGRRHTDEEIDDILDEYLQYGNLPQYVTERQRRDYRKHKRLELRRLYLEQAGLIKTAI